MANWFEGALLDPNSPVWLDKDLFVGLVSSLIGAICSIAVITPLTARYVRLQENRSWRSTRLYYVDSFAQHMSRIGAHLLAIRQKLSHEFEEDDYSYEIVVDMAESVSGLLEAAIDEIDTIVNTFNNSAYAFNAECHFLFADYRRTLTKARVSYASMRGMLPSDQVEAVKIDYITTDRLLIENKEGVVVLGSLFASDVAVAWRKGGRNTLVAGETEEIVYSELFRAFEAFARFACGAHYTQSRSIGELNAFYEGNRPFLDSSFAGFETFRELLRSGEAP